MTTKLNLSPKQVAAMLVIEGALQLLQTGANQLDGFLRYPEAAAVLGAALKTLNDGYAALHRSWANGIIIAPAGAEKTLVAP